MEEPQLGEDGQMLWSKGRTSLDETSYICGPYLLKRGPGRAGPSWRPWQALCEGKSVSPTSCRSLKEAKRYAEEHRQGNL